MSVGEIGVGTTFRPPIKSSNWFTSASTIPSGFPTRLSNPVKSSGLVIRKSCPRGSPSPPTTVQIEGNNGGLQAVCSAWRLRVERTMKLLSARAGTAHSSATITAASQIRCFMAWHSSLCNDPFLSPPAALPQFFLSNTLSRLSPRNHAHAWTSPLTLHSHTPKYDFPSFDSLLDCGICRILPDGHHNFRTGQRIPSPSEANRKEAGRAKASPPRPTNKA